MASLSVRNLDDDTYEALRRRAAAAGRSMEAEARVVLEKAAKEAPLDREAFVAELRRRAIERSGGKVWADSTRYIREDRDHR